MSGIVGIFQTKPIVDMEIAVSKMSKALQHRGNESLYRNLKNQHSWGNTLISVRQHEDNQVAIESMPNHLLIVDSFPFHDHGAKGNSLRKAEIFNSLVIRVDEKGIFILRSLDGTRGLYYTNIENGIVFATEKKSIWAIGHREIGVLTPGCTLSFTSREKLNLVQCRRPEFPVINRTIDESVALGKLQRALNQSFNCLNDVRKCAVLFSGGVDSALAALLTKTRCNNTVLITAACRGSHDGEIAAKSAQSIDCENILVEIDPVILWDVLPEVVYSIETANRMQVEIALPFFLAAREARKRAHRLMVSGQGVDELFAGYARHENLVRKEGENALERTLWNEISMTHETNIQRDARAIAANGIDVFFPYLYSAFVKIAMSLPASFKIDTTAEPSRKIIFRQLAKRCGLPHHIAVRPKRATQYSSGVSKLLSTSIIEKLDSSTCINKREAQIKVQRVLDTIAKYLGIPSNTDTYETRIDLEPTYRLQQRLELSPTSD